MRASVVSILWAGSVTMLAVDSANAENPVKNVQAFEGATLITGNSQAHSDSQTGASFTKVTRGEIVSAEAMFWHGSWGDYDNDGWLDLFVGSEYSSERNYLFHNDRDGTFTLVDDAAMPKIPSNQHGSAWGDYDNDGHLDLIVTAGNPEIAHSMLYRNNGDGTFSWTNNGISSDSLVYANPGVHAPSWGDYDNDGLLDLFIGAHDVFNRLFHNDGGGSFTRILDHVLVNDESSGPASQGRAWVDYDDDGDLDLYVSNLFVLRSRRFTSVLYRNDGDGQFTRDIDSGLSRFQESTFGSCWADYDNDGLADLFLTNRQRNSLYHNDGDGTFTRISSSRVVKDTIPSSAIFGTCAWGDYDNDGFIDLYVTTLDFNFPTRPMLGSFLYHNDGDGGFTRVTEGPVATERTTGASGAGWVDYDNDGFLDLFVAQGAHAPNPQTNLLYHNEGNNNGWLNVKLVGTISNRSAIGAKVRVNAFYRGASRWQVREISGGDGNGNQQSLNAEFGLGDATTIDTVRVEWPSGIVQELHDVAPRQFVTITETLD
jgi:ASPIC and UnbV/FG-GAP-like repeat